MKNCEPLVSFPRLAIDNRKALSCLRMKFSSVGSRERGIDVSVWALWYVFTEIFREEQNKGRNTFIHQTWSLPHQLTSPSITALFKKVLFVSSSGFLMDQTGFLSFRLLLKIAYIFFNHSDHVPKNNILISINFTLLEIDWSSISFL